MAMPKALRLYWAKHGRKSKKARAASMSRRSVTVAKNHHRKQFTLPVAVVAGFAGPAFKFIQHSQVNGIWGNEESGIGELSRTMIGINPWDPAGKFTAWRLRYGLYPILLGILVHKVANWTGINRAIARSGIPVIRI